MGLYMSVLTGLTEPSLKRPGREGGDCGVSEAPARPSPLGARSPERAWLLAKSHTSTQRPQLPFSGQVF